MARRAGIAFVLAITMVAAVAPAHAHVRPTTGYSTMTSVDPGTVVYRTALEYDLLLRAVELGRSVAALGDDAERTTFLRSHEVSIAAYLAERVVMSVDNVQCAGELADTNVERREHVAYARLELVYACPGDGDGRYRLSYSVFSPSDAVADVHTNVVTYAVAGQRGQAVLDTGHDHFEVGEATLLSSVRRFAVLGVEHIWTGVDHLLFLVALVLGAGSLRGVLKVAAGFTAAHSVTLALAAIGWVSVPAAVVEPLIALSIAYVAGENLLGGAGRHRLGVVFSFGLLHGLGFASSLQITGDLTAALAGSFVAFNVGIEIGQALVLAATFAALLAIRRFRWSSVAQATTGGAVAAVGFVWFVARAIP